MYMIFLPSKAYYNIPNMLQKTLFRNSACLAGKTSSFHNQCSLYYPSTASMKSPCKNIDDKDILSPRSSGNVQSCTDDHIASLDKPSYEGSEPDPNAARGKATEQSSEVHDPLEFSDANQDMSKPRGDDGSHLDVAPEKNAQDIRRSSYMGSRERQRRA